MEKMADEVMKSNAIERILRKYKNRLRN